MKRRKHDSGAEYTTANGCYLNTLSGAFGGKDKFRPMLFIGGTFFQIGRADGAKLLRNERRRK